MNRPIVLAAALSAATFFLHVIGGGPEFHAPIQAAGLAVPLAAISAILWHFVSVVLALQAAGLLWLAARREPGFAGFLLALQLGFAALFLIYGWARMGSVWPLPQWTIFLAIAALIGWGTLTRRTEMTQRA